MNQRSNSPDRGVKVPESVKIGVAVLKYIFNEFSVGVAVVVAWAILPHADAIKSMMRFPPDWRPLATYLLPLTALSAWSATRVGTHIYRHALKKAQNLMKALVLALGLLLGGIVLCLLYIVSYSVWVCESTAAPVHHSEASKNPDQPTAFVMPLIRSADFDRAWNLRGGAEYVVDNDAEWLADALVKEGWRVVATKVLLLVLGVGADAVLMVGLTLLWHLPKNKVSGNDVSEAAASELHG